MSWEESLESIAAASAAEGDATTRRRKKVMRKVALARGLYAGAASSLVARIRSGQAGAAMPDGCRKHIGFLLYV